MESWARAVSVVSSSQESIDQLTESHVSVSDSEDMAQGCAFWSPMLKRHTGELTVPQRTSPISLISGCTGSCAEGAVLKEGGLCWVMFWCFWG